MFNLTSSVPKSWQTVSRQADRVTNETVPANGTTHLPPPRDLGGVLRERREAMGASLAEVETATRIRQKYLAALESDEWHLLPGEVVGRGFLRNYATYLRLDPTEAVDRRRSVADPLLSTSLSGTSAGSVLPPERDVDYRPKDVFLRDEPEGIQQREMRAGPFFPVVTIIGVLLLFWWVASNFSGEISAGVNSMMAAMQTRSADRQVAAGITPDANDSANNPVVAGGNDNSVDTNIATQATPASNENTGSNQPANPNPLGQATSVQPVAALSTEPAQATILIPTDTPASSVADAPASTSAQAESEAPVDAPTEAPVNTPEPTPLPTNTPIPPPTETPIPVPTDTPAPTPTDAPPPVVAATCADGSMAFFSPGVNQVLSGAVAVTGRAVPVDESKGLEYYKLEFAPGTNAEGGYVYFDGNKAPVDGGTLGTFNTTALPNGTYTIQLTVVDLTGNYLSPCRTSIVIQN